VYHRRLVAVPIVKGERYMFRRKVLIMGVILAGIAFAGLAPPAQADFRIRVEDTSTAADMGVILTGTVNPLSNPSGTLMFSGSINNFTVLVTVVDTLHNSPTNWGELDITNVSVTGTGPGTLVITAEDTSYSNGQNPLQVNTAFAGTLGAHATLTGQSWADGTNAAPGLGTDAGTGSTAVSLAGNGITNMPTANGVPVFSPPASTSTAGAFSFSGSAPFTSGPPVLYSLYSQITLNVTGAGSISSFDMDTTVTPAPAGLWLALSSAPVFGFGYLRRRRKLQTA
jgi:hypothetical protein